LKLVAWNLGHQTQERAIKLRFIEAVEKLRPDVITLNEYVHGSTREPLLEALAHLGLAHVQVSSRVHTNNQVLIASRHTLHAGDLLGPTTADGGGESNFLHVKLANLNLEIVGVRVPAYEANPVLQDYWQKLLEIIRSTKERRIIFLGDLNADPDSNHHQGSRNLTALRSEGWNVPTPSGAWSYVSGTRIDHAVASPKVTLSNVEYVAQLGDIELASRNKESRISDHAALVLDCNTAADAMQHS
jgi:exonuclease III